MPTASPTPDVGFVVSGTDMPPLCDACLAHEGLCIAHAKSVLPQLAQPHWYRLIGTPLRHTKPLPDESAPVLKAKRRVAKRLQRAMRGEFTKSVRSRTAA